MSNQCACCKARWATDAAGGLCVVCVAFVATQQESLRTALARVKAVGYREDCYFCGVKDRITDDALAGVAAGPGGERDQG